MHVPPPVRVSVRPHLQLFRHPGLLEERPGGLLEAPLELRVVLADLEDRLRAGLLEAPLEVRRLLDARELQAEDGRALAPLEQLELELADLAGGLVGLLLEPLGALSIKGGG